MSEETKNQPASTIPVTKSSDTVEKQSAKPGKEDKASQSLSDGAQKVLDFLTKSDRKQASKFQITTQLQIENENYNTFSQELLEAKRVVRYKCHGWGLRIPEAIQEAPIDEKALEIARDQEEKAGQSVLEEKNGKSLYPYLKRWLLEEKYYNQAEIVGDSHGRWTWENPGIIGLNISDYEFIVGQHIEVVSVEVKLAFTIQAIWQAAQYKRFSHYVYLGCYESARVMREKEDGRLFDVATSFGIGLLSLTPSGHGGTGVKVTEINNASFQVPQIDELDKLLTDFRDQISVKLPGHLIVEQMAKANSKKK